MARDNQILVRVNSPTYDYVTAIAQRTGLSRSTVVAMLLGKAQEAAWTVHAAEVTKAS